MPSKILAIAAFSLLLMPLAMAQPAPTEPEMVLIPRSVAETALNWIATPDPLTAVRLFGSLSACINDNPKDGVVMRNGRDGCPAVTDALAKQAKELADAKTANPPASPPATDKKP
jgi:hypothetical protein